MDDSILQSKRNSVQLESFTSPQNGPAESKATASSWKAILLESKARLKVIQNKTMITISLCSIISLCLLLDTFFSVTWLVINETPNYYYWANLIYLEKICKTNASGNSLCQDPQQVIYSVTLVSLFSSGCELEDDLTLDDPSDLCFLVDDLRVAGALAAFGIWLGLFCHLYCISKFLSLTSKKLKNLIDMPSAKRLTYVTMIFYFVGWLAWLLYSVLALPNDTESSFFGRLGLSLYLFVGGVVIFVILAYWYHYRLASSARMNLVDALLEAENRYSRQVSVKLEL